MDPAGVQMRHLAVYVALCVVSGFVGALSMRLLDSKNQAILQVNRLEVIDARKNVRAILSAQDNGGVSLRLLSEANRPIVTLAASGSSSASQSAAPNGAVHRGS